LSPEVELCRLQQHSQLESLENFQEIYALVVAYSRPIHKMMKRGFKSQVMKGTLKAINIYEVK
jgi:hypothetical protein